MLSKVITIAQQKGGTGKTTLAVHLALAFIKYHNLKIVIIDTDPQGSLGKWYVVRSKKKLSNDNLTFKTASLWGAQYESKALKNTQSIFLKSTEAFFALGWLEKGSSLFPTFLAPESSDSSFEDASKFESCSLRG